MININLVPEELIKKKKYQFIRKAVKGIPAELVVGAVGGILALLVVINILLQFIIFLQIANCQRLQMSINAIAQEKRQVDVVLIDLNGLRQKISVIGDITAGNRVFWAQKLNVVSDVLSSGAWLTRLALDQSSLVIEGKSVSKKNDPSVAVNSFYENLKSNPVFMMGLKNLEVKLVERQKVNTLELGVFSIKAALNAGKQ